MQIQPENSSRNSQPKQRPVDILTDEVAPWWKKTFIHVRKKQVTTWKGALVLMFIAGIASALVFSAKTDYHLSSEAAPASTLYFNPSSAAVAVSDDFTLDALINPGTNQVSAVTLHITFDQTKVRLDNITPSATFSLILAAAVINNTNGTASIDLAVPTSSPSITATSTMATLAFHALSSATDSPVAYTSASQAAADGEPGNVVMTRTEALVTITGPDTAPPTGGSITYANGYFTAATVALTANDGTDISGIDTSSRVVQRRSATLTGGACGTYGAWGDITPTGTYPNFTDATVVTSNCYQYQYLVSDNATPPNQATYVGSGAAKIDTSNPGISLTDPTDGATVSGSSVTVSATASDPDSGVSGVQFKLDGSNLGTEDSSSPYTIAWNTTSASNGSHTLSAVVTDGAGNSATAISITVTAENTITDSAAPAVSDGSPSGSLVAGTTTSTLSVTTDENATCKYSTSAGTAYESMSNTFSTTGGTDHASDISGLSDGNAYQYYVRCQDGNSNANSSDYIVSFSVSSPADSGAPQISDGSPSGSLAAGTTGSTLSVTTDENATCKYSTSAGTAYASMGNIFSTTGGTAHSASISGLGNGGTYQYYVRCSDGSSNINSADYIATFSVANSLVAKEKSSEKKEEETPKRTISQSKESILRGNILIQRGKNFSKSSKVALYFSKANGTYYPPMVITTTKSGAFSVSYRALKPKGSYKWYAVNLKTGWKSKTAKYTVK